MRKVLVIAPYQFLPISSGGQKYIAQFLHYLGKQVSLTVISVPGNDDRLATSYTILPLLKEGRNRYNDFSLSKKIAKEIAEKGFDTIIWEHPYMAWIANRVKKQTGIRTCIHTHNIEYQRFRSLGKWWWPILKTYERWAFRKADGIFFITPEDKNFAITKWGIANEKCIDLPFGVETTEHPKDKISCRNKILQQHCIDEGDKILFFNGVLDYKPNLDALQIILNEINPRLLSNQSFHYKIIICGKNLPPAMNELKEYKNKNIIYAGFVNDIEMYFKGADLFLNPVQTGGGIKTKMVESIGFGTTVIATESGATGIDASVCGDKLIVVKDGDWEGFAERILTNQLGIAKISETTNGFYEKYYWANIIKSVLQSI